MKEGRNKRRMEGRNEEERLNEGKRSWKVGRGKKERRRKGGIKVVRCMLKRFEGRKEGMEGRDALGKGLGRHAKG